jgi:hypothetical protein
MGLTMSVHMIQLHNRWTDSDESWNEGYAMEAIV